ncbi:MAG TPA: hydrogenase 4 subunit B [Burkholderiales bacterium]|jgi:formate hydrogenlyase subunit 3/multisubunit Na+/H+ antiporter MnhD subunit
MVLTVLLSCVAVLLGTAVAAVAGAGRRATTPFVYSIALVVSAAALAVAGWALLGSGPADSVRLPIGLPWLGAHFRVDAVSALFLVVINLGSLTASLYGLGYGRHEPTPGRVLPFFPAFLAGMTLVALADDAFTFLLTWEFMSLASWALVMAHHRHADNARAGYIYLLMASFGTLSLLLAFGLLAGTSGDYAFDAIRGAVPSPIVSAAVLTLALLGAGSKAGLVPLHVWLPLAHPAAPSHVSALMSGVMTKVAVYGFVRIAFDLLGPPAWWWGAAVLTLGGITAVLGVLYALMQHDLKRLLAYHTVENIGIIFIGLGLALAFQANDMRSPAALALTAALFHVFNHSVFKSLLFFGSGAVLTATGERDMERLGGLIHRMPLTAFAFLVGSTAISALPPFNGFVSEWLTFQAILVSPNLPQWLLKFLVPAIGALLALSAALAAGCFVKAFGATFLGRPRTDVARQAQETDAFSLTSMFVLAALCLIAGILPGYFIDALGSVTQQLLGAQLPQQTGLQWLTIVPIAESRSSYNGLLLFLVIVAAAWVTAYVIRRWASGALRRAPAWDCGFPDASPMTQYTSASFAQPIRRVFGSVAFHAREQVWMPAPGQTLPARFHVTMRDLVWDAIYAPVETAVSWAADRLNKVQSWTIRAYLTLVFGAVVVLLMVLAVWQ